MAFKTEVELDAEIASLLADNASGDISESVLRTLITDLKDSVNTMGPHNISNIVASQALAVDTDSYAMVDPTAGEVTLTLPDSATNAGKRFFIKRIANGGNAIRVIPSGSDLIDGNGDLFVLATRNEYLEVISDGSTNWRSVGQRTFAFASIQTSTPDTFALTTGLTKLTTWAIDAFTTLSRLEANSANDQIDIIYVSAPVDGYLVSATVTVEFTNNQTITAQIYADGVLQGVPVSGTGLGSGKPLTLTVALPIPVSSSTSIELHVMGESAGTLTVNSAFMLAERIGG